MTIDEFIRAKRQGFRGNKPQIDKRWNERIAPNGWDKQGRTGADAYLAKYGTGIKVPKLVDIALKAESEFATDFANRFWEEAYRIETGVVATVANTGPAPATAKWAVFPDFIQPGQIWVMQPADASRPKAAYLSDSEYWCIPARGGDRCLLFATPSEVIYQVNSGSTQNSLDPVLDQALAIAASTIGPFILDAEELYRDANAVAHASSKAAARANRKLKSKTKPVLFFSILRALFADGVSLVDESESVRVTAAANVVAYLEAALAEISEAGLVGVELVPISRTKAEKSKLCAAGSGEIWILRTCEYRGGMSGGESMVQTP